MSEFCHICDLFRTALFGPTNAEEDHLGNQGDDLPRPMADEPATVRQRTRGGAQDTKNAANHGQYDASGVRTSNLAPAGVTAVRVATSGPTAPSTGSATDTATASTAVASMADDQDVVVAIAAHGEANAAGGGGDGGGGNSNAKASVKTKFSKRPTRGMKAAPAYMSFDDVDVEDDDSDGELFIEESCDAGPARSSSRSPGGNSYNATPSVYRAPSTALQPPQSPLVAFRTADPEAPAAPAADAPAVGELGSGIRRGDSDMDVEQPGEEKGVTGGAGLQMHGAHPGYRMSIPRDPSALTDGGRPHAQSITESFHGYKGYPGYEPDTPVNAQLPHASNRPISTDSLSIRAPPVEGDRRDQHDGEGAPTPSIAYRQQYSARGAGPSSVTPGNYGRGGSMASDIAEGPPQSISPSGTMEMASVGGDSHLRPLSTTQSQLQHLTPGTRLSYGSRSGSVYRPSPANSIASSFRRGDDGRSIPPMPSEDGMGSVLGTIGGDEATNEDLQWKRSALKKFHKVMVKGEGLRVVKHNRSGGSQVRIIRYDPDIKALVWNSKRYMKKAGSANVPIVGIKRVGREGNTVSVTAAGRGTIGFEPQRIRDAKILAEALRALVDKEERSAMWRG